jgi:hypothetical protein
MKSIDLTPYDFVDFGCSAGSSIEFAKRAFDGRRGLGIDISLDKVASATAAGFESVLADATDPTLFSGQVRFSVLSHFLEHLPDFETVRRALHTAVRISREFVFVRQPWFDADPELFSHRMKFYWSDWSGHLMPLTALQMYRCVQPLKNAGVISRVTLLGNKRVNDSASDWIIPLDAPVNSGAYDSSIHGDKAQVQIHGLAYQELVMVLALRRPEMTEYALRKFPKAEKILDSGGCSSPSHHHQ